MSQTLVAILLVLLGSLWIFIHFLRPKHQKLPPGPRALPIIGNLHMLGDLPHRTLQNLAKKYGPIMSIRLGHVLTVVVSSPQAAELILKTHDTVFATRPKQQVATFEYDNKGLAFSEYGPYWRSVRKLCTLELLSPSKIELFAPVREEELGQFVESLKKSAAAHEAVDLSVKVSETIENMIYRMILGRSNSNSLDLKALIHETISLVGAFNIADYVPYLGALDLQGLIRRTKKVRMAFDNVIEKILEEHKQDPSGQQGQPHRDFVDVLLSFMNQSMSPNDEPNYTIGPTNIKAILFDMIVAALDTSATSIEWTLSELLRHPRVFKHLQEELESVVGMNKMVEEKDLPKLGYLYMVVKESLRLHPVAPLLLPRESREDIEINGYYIPKKSRILINSWAIGRDPNVWSNNFEEFYPERFINSNIDLRGRDFQLTPFGSGRRGCPGMQLGLNTVQLVLAQLVHCFNWELPNGMVPNDLDMSEKFGLAIPRANHLIAVPIYRLKL